MCRTMNSRLPSRLAVLISSLAFLAAPPRNAASEQPQVWKVRTPEAVLAGQPVSVTVRIRGAMGIVSEPVPFDGVLLIDQSGSMAQSDPHGKRIDAATSFVDCVAPDTRLAIVTYCDSVSVVVGLTSDKQQLRSGLEGLRGQYCGATNMYGAIEIADEVLTTGGSADREWYAVLLTDGWDNSGHVETDFFDKATEAETLGIVYFGVALGPEANFGLLYMISDVTKGKAFSSADADGLVRLYDTICQTTSHLVNTRNIILNEKLNTSGARSVRVLPGSVSTSILNLTSDQIHQFEQSGQLLASIGTLGEGEERTVSFQVQANCLAPDAPPGTNVNVDIDDPSSAVVYTFGLSQGSIPVPQTSFRCSPPGDLGVDKSFDPETKKLSISLKNNWLQDPTGVRDTSFKNLVVIDQPSFYFQVKQDSATPTLAAFLPWSTTDYLAWRVPRLGPQETVLLSAVLEPTLCSAQNKPPLDVDAEKYTGMGPGSFVFYRANTGSGEQKRALIPNKTTTLSLVETCSGRSDLFLEPAYSPAEFEGDEGLSSQGPWQGKYAHPRDESPMVFVDTASGNGFWDGNETTISQFISGATNIRAVPGQGDVPLNLDAQNMIWVVVANVGEVPAPAVPHGVVLWCFDNVNGHWARVKDADFPMVGRDSHALVRVALQEGAIQPAFVSPYRLGVKDIRRLIAGEDHQFSGVLSTWLSAHPNVAQALSGSGRITPIEASALLQNHPTIRDGLSHFLATHPNISWGKPSVLLKVTLPVGPSERHTNNNSTTEVVIVN